VIAALDGGATKARFAASSASSAAPLIDSLARIGWSAGLDVQGGMSDAPTAADRSPDRRAVRSTDQSA
jgi:hypothetical protein